jgi:hypothetical protein
LDQLRDVRLDPAKFVFAAFALALAAISQSIHSRVTAGRTPRTVRACAHRSLHAEDIIVEARDHLKSSDSVSVDESEIMAEAERAWL